MESTEKTFINLKTRQTSIKIRQLGHNKKDQTSITPALEIHALIRKTVSAFLMNLFKMKLEIAKFKPTVSKHLNLTDKG